MSEDLRKKADKAAEDLARWSVRHPEIAAIEPEITRAVEFIAGELNRKCGKEKAS